MKSKANKYLIVINIAIVAMFVWHQYKDAAYAKLDEWKLIPRQERFTELYFNDHVNLPKYISKGEKISFSFVIHNLEGEDTQYPYVVYFKSQDGQIVNIEEKSVLLRDGQFKTINESYTSSSDDNNGGIFVELQEPKQGIDFLLNNNN
jgi:hypothetical protein